MRLLCIKQLESLWRKVWSSTVYISASVVFTVFVVDLLTNSVFFCRNLGNCMTRKKKAEAAPVTRYSLRMLGVLYVVDKQPISVLEHSSLKVMLVHCETSNADVSACCQFQINCTAL